MIKYVDYKKHLNPDFDYSQADNLDVWQFVFDFISAQGVACVNDDGDCAYYDSGRRCAAGALLSEVTAKESAAKGVEGWHSAVTVLGLPDKHLALINELQNIHDSYLGMHGFEAWRTRMSEYLNEIM